MFKYRLVSAMADKLPVSRLASVFMFCPAVSSTAFMFSSNFGNRYDNPKSTLYQLQLR